MNTKLLYKHSNNLNMCTNVKFIIDCKICNLEIANDSKCVYNLLTFFILNHIWDTLLHNYKTYKYKTKYRKLIITSHTKKLMYHRLS